MKLKFINLLLAAFLLIGSAQALTSCKDTDEDLYAQLRDENLTLQKNLEAEIELLKGQISDLEGVTSGLKNQIADLQSQINDCAKKSDLNDYVKKAEFNGLVDQYIASVSAYANLTEVLNALKKTQDEVTNAHGDYATIGDRFVAIESALATLKSTLSNYPQIVSDVATLNTFMNTWQGKLGTIEQNATDALAKATQNASDIAALTLIVNNDILGENGAIAKINTILDNLLGENGIIAGINGEIDGINGKLDQLLGENGIIDGINAKLDGILEDYVTSGMLNGAISDAVAGLATTEALNTIAAELRQEAQDNLDAVELRLQQQINTCIDRLNGIDTKVADIEADIQTLQNDMSEAKDNIAANTRKITCLKNSLDNVISRVFNLENRITGIVLNGTSNPVLGYLNTPFGIKSNMLMNYIGENINPTVSIPNVYEEGAEFDGELIITAADYAMLQQCGITGAMTYSNGDVLMNDADGNLGTVYLTLNPANIDLNGKDFTVVTSQNKVVPVALKNLRPSTAELTHGYSREGALSTSANGFYEADATINPADASAIRLILDQSLKSSAKKVLTDRSGSSLAALGNALYDQFNGLLPALGIRAAWQEDNGTAVIDQSVYSSYDIAATVFHPLSYKFLYDRSFRNIHIPDIASFLDKFHFDFGDQSITITFDPIHIDMGSVGFNFNLNFSVQFTDLGTGIVTVEVPKYEIDRETESLIQNGTEPVNVEINFNDLLLNTLNSQLQAAFASVNADINGQLNQQLSQEIDNMLANISQSINNQLNGLMDSLQQNINTELSNLLTQLQNQVNGKIDMIGDQITNNRLYSTLQSIVDRVNKVLDDPNHLLQPVLLYHNNNGGNFGMFSNTIALPTQFTGTGNAVMLTPTTYTGEIVTPAFKKFVAVTNVYKTTDKTVNAQAGDATCIALVKAANAEPYMNEVVPGERRTIPFYFEGGQGYTYEIVYQALDYSGYTSTAKYYVTIK